MRDLKFTWTYQQMVARLKKQEDKCAISDLPMTFKLGRDHELSTVGAKDILKILQNQEGKCYLTGHHLSFETGTWNCVSLERLNVDFGYNKTGNCVLVMQCLNTMDNTSRRSLANQPKEGSGGWTRTKVEYLKNSRGINSSSDIVLM